MNMALIALTADAAQTQDLVTLVPWTFIIQIINLFIQVYLQGEERSAGGEADPLRQQAPVP